MRMTRKTKGAFSAIVAIITMAVLAGVSSGATPASVTRVDLSAGAGAPDASGTVRVGFEGSVLVGRVHVSKLPPQPFGSGRFYGLWFVRTTTNDKAFLGALILKKSIIFSTGGGGEMQFRATKFTDTGGPNVDSPITLGPAGSNVLVVLIENNINGLTPSPVGPVPGTGVAVIGSF